MSLRSRCDSGPVAASVDHADGEGQAARPTAAVVVGGWGECVWVSMPTVADWKAIAARHLDLLDEETRRLTDARTCLAGALLCRYDHPATDCQVVGAEIDRRLASS